MNTKRNNIGLNKNDLRNELTGMKKKSPNVVTIRSSTAEYLTFIASGGDSEHSERSFEMRYADENIWISQKMMAELYDIDVRTVNEHIHKIFYDGELDEPSTIRIFRIVQNEGARQVGREVNHYSLQMIIAVGIRNKVRLNH